MIDTLIFNRFIQQNNLVNYIRKTHRETGFKYMLILCAPFANSDINSSQNPIINTYLWTDDMSIDELYYNILFFTKMSKKGKEFFVITCPECEDPNDFRIEMVRKELDAAAKEWARYIEAKEGQAIQAVPINSTPARLEDPELGKYAKEHPTGADIVHRTCNES